MKSEEREQLIKDNLIALAEAMSRVNNVEIPNKLKIALSKLRNGKYTIEQFQRQVNKLATGERNYLGGS